MAHMLHSATATARCLAAAEASVKTISFRSQFWGFSKTIATQHQQLRLQSSRYSTLLVNNATIAPWLRWWEKGGAANMVDIHSMEEFVESLKNAGDKLVIVEFYASYCTGCKALYPKLCKIAEDHPDVTFLKVNFDENTALCKALNVGVLPLFYVYKSLGHIDTFSCTLSKIKRLKDAIAKHNNAQIPSSTTVVSGIANLLSKNSKSSEVVAVS